MKSIALTIFIALVAAFPLRAARAADTAQSSDIDAGIAEPEVPAEANSNIPGRPRDV